MKRSIIAAALLIGAIVVCSLSYCFLNNTTDTIISLSDTALKSAEENNTEQMLITAQKIKNTWIKKESILSAITPHGETESMDEIIEKLIYFAENKKIDEYKEYCVELKAQAAFIKEEEKLSLRNIF